MIKFIAAAIWICAATLGAAVYSFQLTSPATEVETPQPLLGGLDYVKTDVIAVPVLRHASVTGYFLTQLVYTVDPQIMSKLSVPAESMIVDQVYSYLFGSPEIDFTQTRNLDLDTFRANIREAVNAHVGEKLIHDVMIEQIEFMSKDEIRDNALRRRSTAMKTPHFGAEGAAAKKSSGH